MQRLCLFRESIPAKKAVVTPAAKLGGEKIPEKNPMIPPRIVEAAPRYGPRINPIIGAVIAARVMALVGKPTIGKAGMKQKTV